MAQRERMSRRGDATPDKVPNHILVPKGVGWLLLIGCYGMFALSLSLGVPILVAVLRRLATIGAPGGTAAPTVWIMLGLIGQSITAANLLAQHSGAVGETSLRTILHAFGLGYGIVVGAVGVGVFIVAMTTTVRAVRRGLPFALTWWSFTFPLGTCVTGATALRGSALQDHPVFAGWLLGLSVLFYAVLVGVWAVVASRTVVHSWTGRLFRVA